MTTYNFGDIVLVGFSRFRFASRPAEPLDFARIYTRLYTDVACTPARTHLLHELAYVRTPSHVPKVMSLAGDEISVAYRITLYILKAWFI